MAVGFARVDDGLQLRVGEQAVGDQVLGDVGDVGWYRQADRGHGGGLHQLVGVRLGARDADAFDLVDLVDADGGAGLRALVVRDELIIQRDADGGGRDGVLGGGDEGFGADGGRSDGGAERH